MTDITIYSTQSCAFCHSLTTWLDQQNLKYTVKMTDQDPAAMDEFMAVNDGMISVPFTVIKDAEGAEVKISGFDQGRFKEALGL